MDIFNIFISISGLLLGILIGHLIDRPKIQQRQESNTKLQIEKEQLESDIQQLILRSDNLQLAIKDQGISYQALIAQSNATQTKIDTLKQSLNDLTEQQKTAATAVYNTAKEQAQESYEHEVERLSADLEKRRQEIDEAYLSILNDAKIHYEDETFSLNKNLSLLQEKCDLMKQRLEDERSRVDAAVEVAKRLNEKEKDIDFYRLAIPVEDQQEINKLREVLSWLRNKEPLNKLIYKYYYEKPYTDLIGRVVGQGIHTGIYKITNITNDMCYVGQSTNIAERWRQHIKRGLGAETPTRNKLYPAMYELGPENFTFEIIEECPGDKLNEREQYWQEFYHAKDWGYSIK